MMVKVGAIDLNRPGKVCSHRPVGGLITTRRAVATAGGSACDAEALRRRRVNRPYLIWFAVALAIVDLTACATVSRHQFAEPAREWQARSGQLLYRSQKTTLIGEVLVRFSKSGDFELTFSKGPGVTLLIL